MGISALHPAMILFSRPYQDNSVILDVFCSEQGRLGVVAKHGRPSARNQQRKALLQPFVPVLMSWQGRGALKTLVHIESDGVPFMLQGEKLFSGMYVNELLTRLLHRDDPHPNLYAVYVKTLRALTGSQPLEWVLRRFEMQLLHALGYGVDFKHNGFDGSVILPDGHYRLTLDEGFMPVGQAMKDTFRGCDLLALAAGEETEWLRPVAKRLCRQLLSPHIGQKPLHSRELMKSLMTPLSH